MITKLTKTLSILATCMLALTAAHAQTTMYTVKVDPTENGEIKLDPALPSDGKYPAGTVITVTAIPAAGYGVDAIYYSVPGPFGAAYNETTEPTCKVTLDRDKGIGASFIQQERLNGYKVTNNVEFAQPGVKKLKYDVYSPDGAKNFPCIVIIHGGGWIGNDEDIMRGLARELIKGGKYVVFSVDYRWAQKKDGDEKPNTMANLIEDVYGAIAHIQEHAKEYGGDPKRLAVTGDSAGGHLSAAAANMVGQIGEGGFGVKPGVFEFKPSYIPKGKSVTQVKKDITEAIKAAAPSYGVFANLAHYSDNPVADDSWKNAVSPINFIPNANDRKVPQYLIRGTKDGLIKNENVQAYADALTAAGQTVKYVQVEGAGHAFFDWKPTANTKATFEKYGVPYAADMKSFFDNVFFPATK